MAGKKIWRNKTVQLHFRSSQHPSERTKSKHPRTKKANRKAAAPKGAIGDAPENAMAADDLRPPNRLLARAPLANPSPQCEPLGAGAEALEGVAIKEPGRRSN